MPAPSTNSLCKEQNAYHNLGNTEFGSKASRKIKNRCEVDGWDLLHHQKLSKEFNVEYSKPIWTGYFTSFQWLVSLFSFFT